MTTSFFGRPVEGRIVVGPWSEALSTFAGRSLTLVRTEAPGAGSDRGPTAGASLVGTASLEALASAAGVDTVDGRRFRMLFGVDGLAPHEEDGWLGRRVQVGSAVVEPHGNVGRCAVTTLDPDTGILDSTRSACSARIAERCGRRSRSRSGFGARSPSRVASGSATRPF